ncbi:MAG: conjugal transfer protein TraF [Candidatus Aminicenantes bacterium]|nr:conjugal transfer protein TraF [Candidatus Aminicenantes bacterium]
MKKIVMIILLCACFRPVFPVFPNFHGARSLALGYASLAFNYEINSIYLNPALLSSYTYSLGGLQYENSFMDYFDFSEQLQKISAVDLKNFQELGIDQKRDLLGSLQDVFSANTGINGFQITSSGYAGKGYGLAVEFVDAAIIFPLANDILDKPVEQITNADIASLHMRFIGFHYKDYSVAYSFSLSQGLALGATVHYLKGKTSEFNVAVIDEPFQPSAGGREYLEYAWSEVQKDFSKINFDIGVSADLGPYFKAGVLIKNVAEPIISTEIRDLHLPRRVIAGLAFRPDMQWAICLDIDVAENDLYHNGEMVQPLSLGVEKGFFKNKFFLRAGFLNDLNEKYFFGRHAKIMYGVGLGFNLASFLIDFAVSLDGLGHVKNLGISGFYMIKGKN